MTTKLNAQQLDRLADEFSNAVLTHNVPEDMTFAQRTPGIGLRPEAPAQKLTL